MSDWSLTEPLTLEGWVEDLKFTLDEVGIDKTNIWCTSTSTPIGIRFASKYPERMKTLIDSIKELRKDVNELKITVSKGKGMVAVLVFLGTFIAAIAGWFNYK